MDTNTQELDIKIKNNAMSAYFLIFLCSSFLFVKHNPNVDHPFVRSHTKTALFLHFVILFIITLFLWFDLFEGVSWHNYHLNFILASLCLLGILGLLLKGMYAAHNGRQFMISDITHFIKNEKIVDINHDTHLDEKDKATIIFSLLPFLGYLVYGKYFDNILIKNMSHLNLLCTLFISLIYVNGSTVTANFLLLLWVIGIVFFSIQIVLKGELLSIDMNRVPSFEKIYAYIKYGFLYLKHYFSRSGFKNWQTLTKEQEEQKIFQANKQEQELKQQKDIKFPKWMIYCPLVNIITLFQLNSRQKIHITNGLGLTIISIFSIVVLFYDKNYIFFFLFPIIYGYAFLETRLSYQLPLFYDIGKVTIALVHTLRSLFSKAHTLQKTEATISLKVETKKETSSDEQKN